LVKLLAIQTGVSALALAFWRDLAGSLFLFAALSVLRPSWLRVPRRELGWLLALGGSLGAFHVIWNLGVFMNGAAVATVQQAAMPAIVAIAAHLIWREPLTWRRIVAIAMAFGGTALVSHPDLRGQMSSSASSLLVGVGIPVMYAAWNLVGKRVRQTQNPLTMLTGAFGCAALLLLPFQFFTPQPWPVPAVAWPLFAALVALPTIGGFALYTFALKRLQASVATILAMTEVVFVALYAYLLLGERLAATQVLGAMLVIGGAVLLHNFRRSNADS